MKSYHFLKDDMTAGSGTEKAWTIGETRTYQGEIALCKTGYHSSPSWYDALSYAPGNMACIVSVSKPVEKDDTKMVSATRTLIDARDAEFPLREFACDCTERALKKAKVKDERSWNAIKVSRAYNRGEATKDQLSAAYWAAHSAADSAAHSAARSAADTAAHTAAHTAEVRWQKRRLNWYMTRLFSGES